MVNSCHATRRGYRFSTALCREADAVWEGLRVYRGRIAALEEHLQRLQNSAKALAFEAVPSSSEVRDAIFRTLESNGMRDESHIPTDSDTR